MSFEPTRVGATCGADGAVERLALICGEAGALTVKGAAGGGCAKPAAVVQGCEVHWAAQACGVVVEHRAIKEHPNNASGCRDVHEVAA